MVRDAVRGYWALASGLTEVTRQRALAAAKALVTQGEATAEQVSSLAEDLVSTSVANRNALLGVIQHEVDRARIAVGVVTTSDLDALKARVEGLTAEVAALRAGAASSTTQPAKATKAAKAGKAAKARKAATPARPAKATKTATKTAATTTTTAKAAKAAKAAKTETRNQPAKAAKAGKAADKADKAARAGARP